MLSLSRAKKKKKKGFIKKPEKIKERKKHTHTQNIWKWGVLVFLFFEIVELEVIKQLVWMG